MILHVKKGTQQMRKTPEKESFNVNVEKLSLSNVPRTIARVLVAFLSFFADDFSLFFRLALFTLYIVNRAAADAFLSFLDPVDLSRADPELIVATVLKCKCLCSSCIRIKSLWSVSTFQIFLFTKSGNNRNYLRYNLSENYKEYYLNISNQ